MLINDRIVLCIEFEAWAGYVAAIVWNMLHVFRPSSSTSGGQSDRVASSAAEIVVGAGATAMVAEGELEALVDFRIMSLHAEPVVHCLQGLPSLSRTMPLGSLV